MLREFFTALPQKIFVKFLLWFVQNSFFLEIALEVLSEKSKVLRDHFRIYSAILPGDFQNFSLKITKEFFKEFLRNRWRIVSKKTLKNFENLKSCRRNSWFFFVEIPEQKFLKQFRKFDLVQFLVECLR